VWRILQEYARQDSRVRAERAERSGGIVAATQSALAMARGDFIVFLDHDDELAPEALLVVAAKLGAEPDLDLVYSDEDKIDERGRRVEPFFKPEWSPDLLLSMNYVSHLTVVRRTLLDAVGGLRTGFEGSQDYDLVLRLVERTQRIGHVPRVLYHWRKVPGSTAVVPEAKPYALDSASRALEEALARRETPGRVSSSAPGLYHVRYDVRGQPLVSIVMPTRNKADMLRTCVESIESRTRWGCWELTVVDNGSTDPEALAYLEELGRRHRVIRDERPFNWSALNNAAARGVCGDHLLFMNNDMEVISDEWLEALLEHAQRPEVGAVGARLLYPDGTVQHAGVVLGVGGVANHAFRALVAEDPGYFGLAHVARDVSAVTGACLMTRREAFERQGGFDEQLGVAFNDIDYCLRLGRAGLRVVYTPFALLCHHESATRGTLHPQENEEFMWAQWRSVIEDDPYYSPNLTRARLDYAIRG
jgi:glycosyltransferase involved in cell wall biosynthesis